MSDHLAIYFWGARVGKLFSLLPQGYAFGSTMHAETVEMCWTSCRRRR